MADPTAKVQPNNNNKAEKKAHLDKGEIDIPKSYSREFHKVIQDADVILQILDARDPMGCRSELIENAVKNANARKKLVLVLNKAGKRCNKNQNPTVLCLFSQ
jgi:ribosome biogenesis GTPase A